MNDNISKMNAKVLDYWLMCLCILRFKLDDIGVRGNVMLTFKFDYNAFESDE